MTTLVLLRHGETDWNVTGRWQGQADPPLNEHGRQQARAAAEELKAFAFSAIYSSDLRRAFETAQIIAEELGLEVVPDPRLREIHLGEWQGLLSTEIQAIYPEKFTNWHASPTSVCPPGGEFLSMLATRVDEAISQIVESHPYGPILIVSHELPIAVVRCLVSGVGLGSVRALIPKNGRWVQVDYPERSGSFFPRA